MRSKLAAGGLRRLILLTFFVLLLPLIVPRGAIAQIIEEEEDESIAEDQDSLGTDTVNTTERYLREQAQRNVRVPVLPLLGNEGPRAPLTRTVFTRDSIEWGHAATVGDLLTQIPGIYLWRGGYIGRPEPVNFQARGATSAEYYLDGVPFVPAGIDSIGVDPVLLSLVFLDRLEVERWPGQIKVRLYTRRNNRLASRSRIAIARGEDDYARYDASLERRFTSGFGFSLGADYLNSPTATGVSSSYSNTGIWGQGSYHPTDWVGLQYQLIRTAPNRRPFIIDNGGVEDTIGAGYKATRTDAQIRLSFRKQRDDLGPRADIIYARTGWDGGGVAQQINQIGGQLTYRAPRFSVGGSVFHRTRWTPLDIRAMAGLNLLGPFTVNGELAHLRHFGGRSSDYANISAGLEPVRGLAVSAMARIGKVVAAPALLADVEQDVRDFQGSVAWKRGRLGVEVAYSRTSAFAPYGYADFPRIPGIAPAPRTEWITGSVRIAPLQWITLETWYSDPRGTAPEGLPPTHSFSAATLRSKFLRQFPSGIFDLKLRLSVESWGRGTIGRDAFGAPVVLRGATFFRSLVQVQLDRFSIYWDRTNLSSTGRTYVPGFEVPAYGSNFGVRWEFLN
ncbi:MAG TPA: TonB-dependent receptor [Gemmatimonadales bacterium]|nr:TonB-dependent receptor [Gemmatimonadales bacterium]